MDVIDKISHYEKLPKLLKKLHSVKRWHGDLKMPEGESESDLEHTLDGLRIIKELFDKYKNLAQELNNDDVYSMFAVHDVAEIFSGDAPQEYTKEQRAEHDVTERKLGMLFFRENKEWQEYFRRAFDVACNDKEALFCKYIDKIQAGFKVMDYLQFHNPKEVVNYNIVHYTLGHEEMVFDKLKEVLSQQALDDLISFRNEYRKKAKNILIK